MIYVRHSSQNFRGRNIQGRGCQADFSPKKSANETVKCSTDLVSLEDEELMVEY